MWDSDGPYKVLCLENTNVILESEWKNSLKLIDNFKPGIFNVVRPEFLNQRDLAEMYFKILGR